MQSFQNIASPAIQDNKYQSQIPWWTKRCLIRQFLRPSEFKKCLREFYDFDRFIEMLVVIDILIHFTNHQIYQNMLCNKYIKKIYQLNYQQILATMAQKRP